MREGFPLLAKCGRRDEASTRGARYPGSYHEALAGPSSSEGVHLGALASALGNRELQSGTAIVQSGAIGDRRNVFCYFATWRIRPGWPSENSLDSWYTNLVTSAMLARQVTLLDPLSTTLTPLLRYSYKLFVALEKVNSFVIKQIRTLCAKHPEYGVPLHSVFTSHESPVTGHASVPSICMPFIFKRLQTPFPATPFFSHLYKTPGVGIPQANLLCVTRPPIP